ncbi:MAG: TlpA family protein disulfide reductase [Crocinitomicaceae bacterium]
MTSIKLEQTMDKQLAVKPEQWIIYDINNKPLSFHEFGDKPIVLNFWATWCPPCIAELPGLHEFYEFIKDDAYVLALSDETMDKLLEFQAYKKYPGMIYRYEKPFSGIEFSSYPTTFILAPNFRMVSKIVGAENFATKHNIEFIKSLK